jgi:hypothetical protein
MGGRTSECVQTYSSICVCVLETELSFEGNRNLRVDITVIFVKMILDTKHGKYCSIFRIVCLSNGGVTGAMVMMGSWTTGLSVRILLLCWCGV